MYHQDILTYGGSGTRSLTNPVLPVSATHHNGYIDLVQM